MNTKFTLAIIALVGIGVFALPSTMSLFAGQHSFYNIDASGNQVPCVKCHGDVQAELNSNKGAGLDPNRSPGPHASMECETCHRIEAGASSGDDVIWIFNYVNGTTSRSIAMSVFDFETGNIPATINNTDTKAQIQTANGFTWLNAVVSNSSNISAGNIKLSPPGHGGGETRPAEVFVPLYYENGTAKDINPLTMYSGVRLGSMTAAQFNYSGPTVLPELSFYGLGSRVVNPGSEYHAASLVSCMECHSGPAPVGHETARALGKSGVLFDEPTEASCNDCHYGGGNPATGNAGQQMRNLWAGGFGVTAGKPHSKNDTGAVEAHTPWVTSTEGVSRFAYGANNDACIACHTHVAVDITFDKAYKLKITATAGGSSKNGTEYVVSNAGVEGHVVINVFGNQSGSTWAVGDQSITWTPTETLYISGDKGKLVNGLSDDAVDDETALQ